MIYSTITSSLILMLRVAGMLTENQRQFRVRKKRHFLNLVVPSEFRQYKQSTKLSGHLPRLTLPLLSDSLKATGSILSSQ